MELNPFRFRFINMATEAAKIVLMYFTTFVVNLKFQTERRLMI